MKTYIDLHMHSTASDGTMRPAELIEHIASLKSPEDAAVVALTDHDTLDGVREYCEAARKSKANITAIPGIEISTTYKGEEIHMLGYFVDLDNVPLNDALKKAKESRSNRSLRVLEKLKEQNMEISLEDIEREEGTEISRPHIAAAMIKKGYVSSVKEAFKLYLGEGKSCYVGRTRIDTLDAVRLIREAGGIPVIAHIMLYDAFSSEEKAELVQVLCKAGLQGIESYYSTYTDADREFVLSLARQNGLHPTGGSDFHGAMKPGLELFKGYGSLDVPESVLEIYAGRLKGSGVLNFES